MERAEAERSTARHGMERGAGARLMLRCAAAITVANGTNNGGRGEGGAGGGGFLLKCNTLKFYRYTIYMKIVVSVTLYLPEYLEVRGGTPGRWRGGVSVQASATASFHDRRGGGGLKPFLYIGTSNLSS